jgi:hypothetical protein
MEKMRADSRTLPANFTGNQHDPAIRWPVDDKLLLVLDKKTFMLRQLIDLFAASAGHWDRRTDQAYHA